MKNFGTFIATNGDIADNAPEELTRPTDQAFNNPIKELLNTITNSGQTPTVLTNDDLTQLSKAVNIHSMTAQTWDCTNSGNNYTLTRFLGDYDISPSLYAGAKILFKASAKNTGDVNITISAGALTINKQLLFNGLPLIGGELKNGEWYEIVYYADSINLLTPNLGTAAFINIGSGADQVPDMSFFEAIVSGQTGYQKLPSGFMMQWGSVTINNGLSIVTFPIAFKEVRSISVTSTVSDASACCATGAQAVSETQFRAYARAPNSTAGATITASWLVIGSYK
ncbi:gp53-like domain-containing protein [Neisseria sp. Ec49-e6-T10]|uniref:gp53-like domain-containing protein n=1 Tax=Neisseria sp. Ec49-e6-T10 TaxID=3140744 RepID=UPI003EBFB1C9